MRNEIFPKTADALARLRATCDRMIARDDEKAIAFAERNGWSMDALRYGALRRSADFADPRTGVAEFVNETFPKPAMARAYLRALLCRSLGMEG